MVQMTKRIAAVIGVVAFIAATNLVVDILSGSNDAKKFILSTGFYTLGVAFVLVTRRIRPLTEKRACEIMGENMLGSQEMADRLEIDLSKKEVSALSKIRYRREELELKKDTHVLVPVFISTINEVRAKFYELFKDESWDDAEAFADDHGLVGWYRA